MARWLPLLLGKLGALTSLSMKQNAVLTRQIHCTSFTVKCSPPHGSTGKQILLHNNRFLGVTLSPMIGPSYTGMLVKLRAKDLCSTSSFHRDTTVFWKRNALYSCLSLSLQDA